MAGNMTQEEDEKEFEEWWFSLSKEDIEDHYSFSRIGRHSMMRFAWLASRRLLREKEGKDG